MIGTKGDPLTDWQGFFNELQKETPRGAVIIAGAFLDAQLRVLLSKFLVDDPKIVDELIGSDKHSDCPLSTFSSRIKAAYCLGLIGKGIYQDLNAVRKIRNKFAHKTHGYSFDEPEIVNWCKSLKLAKMITEAIPNLPDSHGNMFILGVTQLAHWLAIITLEQEKDRRTVPKDPRLGQVVRATKPRK